MEAFYRIVSREVGALRSSGAFLRPVCTQIAPRIRPFRVISFLFFFFLLDSNFPPLCFFPFFFFFLRFVHRIDYRIWKEKNTLYRDLDFKRTIPFVKRNLDFFQCITEDEWKKTFGFNLEI